MHTLPPYKIIREETYERDISNLGLNYKRIVDLETAIDWALSRKPKAFERVVENFYMWGTVAYNILPQLLIIYQVDERNKTVLLIRAICNY